MKSIRLPFCILFIVFVLLSVACSVNRERPVLFLVGDSTVAEGSGNKGLWGWGKFLPEFFDTTRIIIDNYAVGGTSTRTFLTNGIWNKDLMKKGLWDTIITKIKPGDYLLIQFGHNDASPIADTARARGSLKGIGNDTVVIQNFITQKEEVVYSYGRYLQRMIDDAKSIKATPIICSPIPRNKWENGKVIRDTDSYTLWAEEVAKKNNVPFINLNNDICDIYDNEGEEYVDKNYFHETDNTHTLAAGAKLNARVVAKNIVALKNLPLKKFLNESAKNDINQP